jgi:Icc protein
VRRTLIQISDTHLLGEGLQHDRIDTLANLDLVLRRVEASDLRPDLILLTGDLADRGEHVAYRALRRRVEAASDRLGAPALYLPGNHDDRAALRGEVLGEEPGDEPIDQVTWCGGLRVVALDSTVPGEDGGELAPEQLEWLSRLLADAAPEGTLVALHHPPVHSPIASMGRIALRRPEQLAAALAGSDVRMIVAGHNHHAMAGVLGSIPVWVGPATAYQADPLVPDGRFRGFAGVAFARIDLGPGEAVATAIVATDCSAPVVEIETGGQGSATSS